MSPGSAQKLRFQGKNAIVTGASRGLGFAVAQRLLHEGASVLLTSRSDDALAGVKEGLGSSGACRTHILAADLSDQDTPKRIIGKAKELWPTLDVLVNNAAMLPPIGPFESNDWTEWRNTVEANFLAPVALTQLALKWMLARENGSVINISGGGATSPRPGFSAYSCSKTALVRFTETVAAEVADKGIRINCVAPGVMNTEMLKQIVMAGPDRTGEQEYERARAVGSQTESIERATDLIVFLASSESGGVTGRLISAVWDYWRDLPIRASEIHNSDIYTLRRITPADRGKSWS